MVNTLKWPSRSFWQWTKSYKNGLNGNIRTEKYDFWNLKKNHFLDVIEEQWWQKKVSELEDRSMEIIQFEEQSQKKIGKKWTKHQECMELCLAV